MFKNLKITVGQKILGSFLLVIAIIVINAVIISNTSSNIDQMVSNSATSVRPSSEKLNEMLFTLNRSKILATNWVFLPSSIEDKAELKLLHNTGYPKLRQEMKALYSEWDVDSLKLKMDSIISDFDRIIRIQNEEVMMALITFEDYENPMIRFTVDDILESELVPAIETLSTDLNEITEAYKLIREKSESEMLSSMDDLTNITFALTLVNVIIAMGAAYFLINNIRTPVRATQKLIAKLGKGEVDENHGLQPGKDEIGDMGRAVVNLLEGLKSTSEFAEEIGKGNYASEFRPLSHKDTLGNALLDMRANLSEVKEEAEKRQWSNEGVAKFAELLRNYSDNLEQLSDELLRNLVKYMGANQGGLYLIDTDENDEEFLYLSSCFAWEKQKFLEQRFYKGEGLAGQAWQEGAEIYLTDVPQNYISLTSGLGDGNPSSIFIAPLKVNEDIFGIIELASFTEIEDYRREFLFKLGESIASTINNVKNSARTRKLLEESQLMTEQMKSQEEEMRQNMEEIQSTQEEMERNQNDTMRLIEALNKSVISVELEPSTKVDNINDKFLEATGYESREVYGETFRMFFGAEKADDFKRFWKNMQSGIPESGIYEFVAKDGSTTILKGTFNPFMDGSELSKVLFYGIDVTSISNNSEELTA